MKWSGEEGAITNFLRNIPATSTRANEFPISTTIERFLEYLHFPEIFATCRNTIKSVETFQDNRHNFACSFLEEGMAAIVGPKSPSNIAVLHSTCDTFQIPLLLTNWASKSQDRSHVINFYPETRVLAKAYTEFIKSDSWKSFTLIFEDNEALIRLQDILQLPTSSKTSQMKITLRHVKPDQDFTKFMKDLSKMSETNFVVDLPLHRVRELFIAADKIKMLTEYQKYLLTSLDAHTVDWAHNTIGRSNITAFQLINPDSNEFKTYLKEWIFSEQTGGKEVSSKQPITTEAALLYDAILMLSRALNELDRGRPLELKSLYCDGSATWEYGKAIISYMKIIYDAGATFSTDALEGNKNESMSGSKLLEIQNY
ncbi:glutamate receptor ionotropic, kainate 1 [Caerostris extrusa]|uniref:Glutamate receptor ionotropic, kainate 1 n=1 Tax=Caerostris extrusa TaxID=172846 RepID=A0AAV4NYG5_CAEEX|nr:glutamate receptor ionotropic, kainate 1 [Caerostris extrusa]